jgi:serine/threonine protein kinase
MTDTPTVQQGQSTPTVQQGQSTPTVQQGEQPSQDTTPRFPDQLRDRFDPLECRGHGTEGAVWRCTSDGHEVAVKVGWVGRPMDAALLEHLRDKAFRRHVPAIHEHGTLITPHGEVAWVAMEYFPTTLAQTIAAGPLPPERAKTVLTELAAALEFWQTTVDRNPLDFKPDNLMFRDEQIVVADFGGVSAFTASQQQGGTAMAAVAYTPPEETWQEKRSPWPWWSLGEIAYQLVTGHTRFQLPGGDMPSNQVIIRKRELNELGLDHVRDPRWKLLIRGLLARDPHDRWTHHQVRTWLAGGSPRVATEIPRTEPAHSPITFGDGRTFTDPAELARAMSENWRVAADWLAAAGRQTLLDWLKQEKLLRHFDTSLLRTTSADNTHLHRAILAFSAVFAPDSTPRMCGHAVDADGLPALLTGPNGFATARRLVTADVVGLAAGHRCQHTECDGHRCTVLDRVARDLNSVVTDVGHLIAAVGADADGPWEPVSEEERDHLHGLALFVLLSPRASVAMIRGEGLPLFGTSRWWRGLRARALAADPGTHDGAVALVTAAVLCRRAVAERAAKSDGAVTRLQPRRLARAVVGGVLGFVALVLVAWVVGRLGTAAFVFQVDPVAGPLAAGNEPGYYLRLAPALMLLSIVVVLLGRGNPGWFLGACVLTVALAATAPRLPTFTLVELPGPVEKLFLPLLDAWRGEEALGVGIVGFAALLAGIGATRLLTRYRTAPGRLLPQAPVAVRKLAVAVLVMVMLPATLWACGAIRLTVSDPGLTPWVGRHMAYEQAGYLLILLLTALVVGLGWPRTEAVLVLALVVVAGVGLWAQPIPAVDQLRDPVAVETLAGIADLWGGNAFWVGLLGYLPLTVAGFRLAHRVGR